MKTPPEMLSPKDTAYISDLMRTILVIYKKLDDEVASIADADVKTKFNEATTLLTQQYNTLLGFLK